MYVGLIFKICDCLQMYEILCQRLIISILCGNFNAFPNELQCIRFAELITNFTYFFCARNHQERLTFYNFCQKVINLYDMYLQQMF